LSVLQEAADKAGVKLRTDYSGRGMMGQTCIGVVHKGMGPLLTFVVEFAKLISDSEFGIVWLEQAATDDMGLQTITYWPKVQAEVEV
jgi:hypothetical protein